MTHKSESRHFGRNTDQDFITETATPIAYLIAIHGSLLDMTYRNGLNGIMRERLQFSTDLQRNPRKLDGNNQTVRRFFVFCLDYRHFIVNLHTSKRGPRCRVSNQNKSNYENSNRFRNLRSYLSYKASKCMEERRKALRPRTPRIA